MSKDKPVIDRSKHIYLSTNPAFPDDRTNSKLNLELNGYTITYNGNNLNKRIYGIRSASTLVVVMSQASPYAGNYVEIGMALAFQIKVVIIKSFNSDNRLNMYMGHPSVTFYNNLMEFIN